LEEGEVFLLSNHIDGVERELEDLLEKAALLGKEVRQIEDKMRQAKKVIIRAMSHPRNPIPGTRQRCNTTTPPPQIEPQNAHKPHPYALI
jgi:hypothetical protein